MTSVEEKIVVIELYDLYQSLLTKKQQEYFEAAYYDDSSISEIADEFGVSRNAVHDQLKKTIAKLLDFESALNCREKRIKTLGILEQMKDSDNIDRIKELIQELEKVE
jgi:predicted DNA-binding protein YlxM (UPF0122 family)